MTSKSDAAGANEQGEQEKSPSEQADTPLDEQTQAAGESLPQGEGADPIAEIKEALIQAQAQAQSHYEQMLRAQAEMENVRRRAQEEVSKARKFGIESFAESLVPVKDSLEAALGQVDQSPEDMRAGIETTLKQLSGAFERNHLKEIAPAPGDKFDPHLHQAIATVPAEQESNTVVAVLQKGYLISERVLRPALVTVAS